MSGVDQYTTVMLHFDGQSGSQTILDSKNTRSGDTLNNWISVGGAQLATRAKKFGDSSLLASRYDYVQCDNNSNFEFGSGDWTIDLWFYHLPISTAVYLFGQNDQAPSDSSRTVSGGIYGVSPFPVFGQFSGTDGLGLNQIIGSTPVTDYIWHHYALIRDGSFLKLFLDGIQQQSSLNVAGKTVQSGTTPFVVGAHGDYPTGRFAGFIDEFRISLGVARWTEDFTPSRLAYSQIHEPLMPPADTAIAPGTRTSVREDA